MLMPNLKFALDSDENVSVIEFKFSFCQLNYLKLKVSVMLGGKSY